jgi:hypothetical protein
MSRPRASQPPASSSRRMVPEPQHGSSAAPLGSPARSTMALATVGRSAPSRSTTRPPCWRIRSSESRSPATNRPCSYSLTHTSICAGSWTRHRGRSRWIALVSWRRRSVRRKDAPEGPGRSPGMSCSQRAAGPPRPRPTTLAGRAPAARADRRSSRAYHLQLEACGPPRRTRPRQGRDQ